MVYIIQRQVIHNLFLQTSNIPKVIFSAHNICLKEPQLSRRKCSSLRGQVRVRFAPSPTGELHLGGLRTALYNYLLAKSTNGKFVLRIEDTDEKRCRPEYAERLHDTLQWAGVEPDEGPFTAGGDFGPYLQSKRTHLYEQYAQQLLQADLAYRCFCTPTRLELLRKDRARRRLKPTYDNRCRALTREETTDLLKEGVPYTMRVKISPLDHHDDLIHGRVASSLKDEGDFILLKSDGGATYHLANVVDDHLMRVTHVLRGQEWLVSTAKHLLLYKYFNWHPPQFGHLPLLTNMDGSKLSKRQHSLQISELRKQGYTPRALTNFLLSGSLLQREATQVFSLHEVCRQFDVNQLNIKSAMLDMDRLNNFSRLDLLRRMQDSQEAGRTVDELRSMVKKAYGSVSSASLITPSFISEVVDKCAAVPLHCLQQLVGEEMEYVWRPPQRLDMEAIFKVLEARRAAEALQSLKEKLQSHDNFTRESLSEVFTEVVTEKRLKLGQLMKLLRIVICGGKKGAAIGDLFATLGKDESVLRVSAALHYLAKDEISNVYS